MDWKVLAPWAVVGTGHMVGLEAAWDRGESQAIGHSERESQI